MKRNTAKDKKKNNKGFPYKKTRKPKKLVVPIFFGILVLFALIGSILVGGILHEHLHRLDYRHIEKISDEICYLDSNIEGYYKFTPKPGQDEEIDTITQFTELRAYIVSAIILIIFLISFSVTTKHILEIKNAHPK